MPNVGRPSKGCKNCRDRKVKCDQKRPSCSQCLRIGKECHGYRDPLEMMFKNESNVVARKAKNRYEELAKQKGQKSSKQKESQSSGSAFSGSSEIPSPASSTTSDQQIVPITRYPPTPESMTWEIIPSVESIEDQAQGFFFSNYVVEPTFVPRGNFEWIPPLINRPDTERILQSSVNAACLASLANSTKNPTIMKKAQEEYVSALSMTNQALRVAEIAKKDSTLIAVIMLGMYENFVFQEKTSIQAWAKHIQGACALLRLRGEDNFKGKLGTLIFHQFYGTALLVCLENRMPIPDGITELWERCTQIGDYSIQGKHWTTEMVRWVRNSIHIVQDKTTDPVTMVKTALKLERDLDGLKALIPNIWKHQTVYLEKPMDHVYRNFYHIYMDPWIAQMWNNLRACRLYLHRVIREQLIKGAQQLPHLFSTTDIQTQTKASEQIMRTTVAGICAAVPQIIGQIPFPDVPATKPSPSTYIKDLLDPEDPRFKLHSPGTFLIASRPTGVHHLIWPLYAVGEFNLSPNDRQWAIDQLNYLALTIGTRQAVVLAEDLKDMQKRESI